MKTFKERLKGGAFGSVQIISAFVFVVIVGLLAIFAAAEKKNEPFNAFIAAAGALGQVFFAYMVWRLGREQFEFSKIVSDRQVVVDLLPIKAAYIEEYHQWSDKHMGKATDTGAFELSKLLVRGSGLYGKVLYEKSALMRSSYEAFVVSQTVFEAALKSGHEEALTYRATNYERARATAVAHGQFVGLIYQHMRSVPVFDPDPI